MTDPRAALRPLLTQRLTPSEREALAAALEAIAAEQRALAAAERRDASRPATQRLIRQPGARTGRPGAMYCYLEQRDLRDRAEPGLSLRIGRGVFDAYQALRRDPGAPLRLAVQVVGAQLRLVEDPSGYLATVNAGGVRLNVSGARDHLARLPLRQRWPAKALPGRIVAELGQ